MSDIQITFEELARSDQWVQEAHLEAPPGIVHSRQLELSSPAFLTLEAGGAPQPVAIDTLDREAKWLRAQVAER